MTRAGAGAAGAFPPRAPLQAMINHGQVQDGWFGEPADIETASDGYARRFSGETGEWMLSVQERITLAFLRETGVSTVLDVGGGHGQLAIPMCREGYAVTVVGSADACGRRLAGIIGAGVCRFEVADLLRLPYPAKTFDAVVCFRLATHCPRWQTLVAELCRVARHAVIMDYPTSESVNFAAPRLFGVKKKIEGNTRTFKLFRHADIDREFAANGFAIAAREKQFFLPMALHRAIKSRAISSRLENICRRRNLTGRWGSPVIAKALRVKN